MPAARLGSGERDGVHLSVAPDSADIVSGLRQPSHEAQVVKQPAPTTEHVAPAPGGERAGLDPQPRGSVAAALLRGTRPKQWLKNALVAAAPAAAGVLTDGPTAFRVLLAFVAFCLASSGTYLLNDVRDAEADRRHPRKRKRPVAAGLVTPAQAVTVGVALLAAALALSLAVGVRFLGAITFYVVLTTSYSLWLKRIAVVDMAAVASGFIVRAVAGGLAAAVPLSRWFLIVASFGSLFVVAGKRYADQRELGEARPAVSSQTPSRDFFRYVWAFASAVATTAYCLWAFEQAALADGFPWYELSVVPFVLFVLRYALLLDGGGGSAPEEIVLGDRTLLVTAVAWLGVFACGVYLGG